ncbi:MAG: hypothetical protein CVT76_11415 [Alphaproteobacteria bacterium HGW-Alphaproteobacteria-15]|nr:MAG: hypothetical protein CVT76_11415 [Alphaproteobacteria bacterium HGW-Alphaproteobacteria-15]
MIPVLGEQGAADLQAKLIRATVAMAVDSGLAPVQLWFCGADGQTLFDEYCSDVNDDIHVQSGKDLGARMDNAFVQTLQDSDFAVLIGTDCPVMGRDYLESACAALAAGSDAVLGPAEDGGYVLIGLRHCDSQLFENVAWGTADVLNQTRQRLDDLGWSRRELATQWDVDYPKDLKRLFALDASFYVSDASFE